MATQEGRELAPAARGNGAAMELVPVQQLAQRRQEVQRCLVDIMRESHHYGKIPGTDKPTLYLAGAQLLGSLFQLRAEYEIEQEILEEHRIHYTIRAKVYHIPSGAWVSEGLGSCSSLESKYRYRSSSRRCPQCNSTAIIKGKKEYGGGWLCFAKRGGCGAKFGDRDPAIVNQPLGKIENPDPYDQCNTILKMAKKRAHVDAIINATAASDMFTQDLEEEEIDRLAAAAAEPEAETEEAQGEPKERAQERKAAEETRAKHADRPQREAAPADAKLAGQGNPWFDYLRSVMNSVTPDERQDIVQNAIPHLHGLGGSELRARVTKDDYENARIRVQQLGGPSCHDDLPGAPGLPTPPPAKKAAPAKKGAAKKKAKAKAKKDEKAGEEPKKAEGEGAQAAKPEEEAKEAKPETKPPCDMCKGDGHDGEGNECRYCGGEGTLPF